MQLITKHRMAFDQAVSSEKTLDAHNLIRLQHLGFAWPRLRNNPFRISVAKNRGRHHAVGSHPAAVNRHGYGTLQKRDV
jgi:hypothetical protein